MLMTVRRYGEGFGVLCATAWIVAVAMRGIGFPSGEFWKRTGVQIPLFSAGVVYVMFTVWLFGEKKRAARRLKKKERGEALDFLLKDANVQLLEACEEVRPADIGLNVWTVDRSKRFRWFGARRERLDRCAGSGASRSPRSI